jgi:5-methylthioribose kinase
VSFELQPDATSIEEYLDERGWLEPGEHVERAEPAGEGNMNRTVRIVTGANSFVLKQACPFVVKYPDIPAPIERIVAETRFYEVAHLDGVLSEQMPRVIAFDAEASLALLEDLGAASDLSSLYDEAAARLQRDDAYVARVIALGMIYLQAEGPSLLHGDFYPGSFLRTEDGLRVIDPEFAFPGPPEFDMGVFSAHLILSGEEADVVATVSQLYGAALDPRLLRDFAAAELMRRLIGIAQLPLAADIEQKQAWLDLSRSWLLSN